MSIGLSRLISRLFRQELVTVSRSVPSAVLVAVGSEDERAASNRVANALRDRGIAAETSPNAAKFGRQIRYADRRGIPFVWFIGAGEDRSEEHTSELQSRGHIVCRLLLEKKNKRNSTSGQD